MASKNYTYRHPTLLHSNTPQTPPYSQEAEEAVLGAILIAPGVLTNARGLKLKSKHFFFVRHQYIYDAILSDDDDPEFEGQFDYLTVINGLRASGKLDEIGGPAYISRLMNNTPTVRHAEVYILLIKRTALRRELLEAADEIRALALDENKSVEEIKAEVSRTVARAMETVISRQRLTTIGQGMSEYYDQIEKVREDVANGILPIVGVSSGLHELNKLILGFQPSDFIVVAGRPGMGKSALMLNFAITASLLKKRVYMLSLEMSAEQIVQRYAAYKSKVNLSALRQKDLTEEQWARFVAATGGSGDVGLYLDDAAAMTPEGLEANIAEIANGPGLDLIIVDYLQLMSDGGRYAGNKVQEITYISRKLKELAKTWNVPVIAASQLNRGVEQRSDRTPVMSDLRDSGSIEQDADIIIMLYRQEYYDQQAGVLTDARGEAQLIVAKNRQGETGSITVGFDGAHSRFYEYGS